MEVPDEVIQSAFERQLIRNRRELTDLIFRNPILRIGQVLNQVEGTDAKAFAQQGPDKRVDERINFARSTNPGDGFKLFCYNLAHFSAAERTVGPEPILALALFTVARWDVREHVRGVTHINRFVDQVQVLLGKSRQIINDSGRYRKSLKNPVEVDQREEDPDDNSP